MGSRPKPLLARLAATHSPQTNKAKLLLWRRFLTVIFAALRQAEKNLQDPQITDQYKKLDGWWRQKTRETKYGKLLKIPNEDAITDAVHDQLQKIRDGAKVGSPLSDMGVVFALHNPRKKQDRIGRKSLDTDLYVYIYGRNKPDFTIEAKILFEDQDLAREYCSDRGIRRYADVSSPYTQEIIGAMMGYGLTHNGSVWEGKIIDALSAVECVDELGLARIDGEPRPTVVCDVVRADQDLPCVTVLHLVLELESTLTEY